MDCRKENAKAIANALHTQTKKKKINKKNQSVGLIFKLTCVHSQSRISVRRFLTCERNISKIKKDIKGKKERKRGTKIKHQKSKRMFITPKWRTVPSLRKIY